MKNYEVVDLVEIGDAGEVIETLKPFIIDEVGGNDGPARDGFEDE